MFQYLALTDGTTLAELTDMVNYALVSYAPGIPQLRDSLMGGAGPYADVQDTITFHAIGCTAADAYAAAATVVQLLDSARRWWYAQGVSPVTIQAQAQGGSQTASFQAVVKGRPVSGPPSLALPAVWDETIGKFIIRNITIQFTRRGQWVREVDTTAASGAASNGSVLTRAFTVTNPVSSPLDVTIGGFDKTATPTIKAGYLMVGSNVNDIVLVSPPGSVVAKWTSVADAANLAMFGNVLRYTPTDALPSTSGSINFGGPSLSGPCAIIAAVRNNGASTYQLHANLIGLSGTVSTPDILIDASTANPRLVLLGVVSGTGLTSMSMTATASSAVGSLDMNYAYVVNLRDETVAVVAHDDIVVSAISAGTVSLLEQFIPYSDLQPKLQAVGSASSPSLTYRGALPFMTVGINVYAVWIATNANFWVMTNNVNAVVNVTLQVTRYRSYAVPQ